MVATVKRTGDWKLLKRTLSGLPTRVKAAQKIATFEEAHHYRRMVLKAFKTSGRSNGKAWEPNKRSVLANKGSSKPLIDRGDLRNSIVVVKRGKGFWVGVSSRKRSRDGSRLVDIAAVHEFGRVIAMQVTPKMHAYVMAQLAKNGGGGGGGSGKFKPGAIIVIKIPERSFLRATAKAHFKPAQVQVRMVKRMSRLLGGAFRGPR